MRDKVRPASKFSQTRLLGPTGVSGWDDESEQEALLTQKPGLRQRIFASVTTLLLA